MKSKSQAPEGVHVELRIIERLAQELYEIAIAFDLVGNPTVCKTLNTKQSQIRQAVQRIRETFE